MSESELASAILQSAEQDTPRDDAAAGPGDARYIGRRGPEPATAARPFDAPSLDGAADHAAPAGLELLDDVDLDVKIELGRTSMYIEDVLNLHTGSVVELDKLAGDPVDIYVNEKLVARGEVLVLNDNFCVRVNDIVSSIPELEGEA